MGTSDFNATCERLALMSEDHAKKCLERIEKLKEYTKRTTATRPKKWFKKEMQREWEHHNKLLSRAAYYRSCKKEQ